MLLAPLEPPQRLELRTPLNAIAGHAQLLEMGVHGPITDAQREALRRISRSESHLLALINDVLNFAKLEAGRVEYELEDVPLAATVNDVVSMVEGQIAAKGLSWETDVGASLTAHADVEKVHQILINLLTNAIKFTGRGGMLTIASVPADDPNTVALRITDTGIGIPREKQETIFDPFVQVHRQLTRNIEGTGLGLAISRDLARGMGGDLTVESELGAGASFTLTLPAARPMRAASSDTTGAAMADERDRERSQNDKDTAKDVMHGRSFAGTNWAADEETQTRAKNRPDESDEFVTDAELEAREANGEIGGERSRGGEQGSR
jgi:signal transduction histidine kinase